MAKIVVKGNQGGGGGWSPLPNGPCDFQIDSTEQTTSGGGTPQLKIGMQVIGNHPNVGKAANDFVAMSPKALWRLKDLLIATDTPFECVEIEDEQDDNGKPLEEIAFDDEDLIGKSFTCDVTTETYNDKENNKFKNYRKLGTSVMTRAEREAAAAAAQEPESAPAAKAAPPPAQRQTAPAVRSTQPAAKQAAPAAQQQPARRSRA